MSVFGPAEVGVRLQEPVPPESVTLQLTVPSETATVPAGVPDVAVTETATEIVWPMIDGSGLWLVIVVVVAMLDGSTWWAAPTLVEAAKFAVAT